MITTANNRENCAYPHFAMDHIMLTKPCTVQDWANAMKANTDNANHHLAIDALALLLNGKSSSSDAAEQITTAYKIDQSSQQTGRCQQ